MHVDTPVLHIVGIYTFRSLDPKAPLGGDVQLCWLTKLANLSD